MSMITSFKLNLQFNVPIFFRCTLSNCTNFLIFAREYRTVSSRDYFVPRAHGSENIFSIFPWPKRRKNVWKQIHDVRVAEIRSAWIVFVFFSAQETDYRRLKFVKKR